MNATVFMRQYDTLKYQTEPKLPLQHLWPMTGYNPGQNFSAHILKIPNLDKVLQGRKSPCVYWQLASLLRRQQTLNKDSGPVWLDISNPMVLLPIASASLKQSFNRYPEQQARIRSMSNCLAYKSLALHLRKKILVTVSRKVPNRFVLVYC